MESRHYRMCVHGKTLLRHQGLCLKTGKSKVNHEDRRLRSHTHNYFSTLPIFLPWNPFQAGMAPDETARLRKLCCLILLEAVISPTASNRQFPNWLGELFTAGWFTEILFCVLFPVVLIPHSKMVARPLNSMFSWESHDLRPEAKLLTYSPFPSLTEVQALCINPNPFT